LRLIHPNFRVCTVLVFVSCLLAGGPAAVLAGYQPGVKGDASRVIELQVPGYPAGPLLSLHKPIQPLERSHIRKGAVLVFTASSFFDWRFLDAVGHFECAGRNIDRSSPIPARPPPFVS
jgi:hypothetical protein